MVVADIERPTASPGPAPADMGASAPPSRRSPCRALAVLALSASLVATPAWARPCAGLTKKPEQTWMQFAGQQARAADKLEKKGLQSDARTVRERVMLGLTCAWRRDNDPAALEPLLIQLHRRLRRSTTAVEVALRLIYELHEAPKLTDEQRALLDRLNAQLDLALLRLRRDAKPGDAAACDGPVGRRPGELAIQGLLPDEPVLVLRDVPGGEVEVVECPLAAPEARGVPNPVCPECPPPVEALGDEPWWLAGAGVTLLLAGGAMLVMGDHYASKADGILADLGDPIPGPTECEPSEVEDGQRIYQCPNLQDREVEARQLQGRSDSLYAVGIGAAALGLAAGVIGLVWGLGRGDPVDSSDVSLSIGPRSVSVGLSF